MIELETLRCDSSTDVLVCIHVPNDIAGHSVGISPLFSMCADKMHRCEMGSACQWKPRVTAEQQLVTVFLYQLWLRRSGFSSRLIYLVQLWSFFFGCSNHHYYPFTSVWSTKIRTLYRKGDIRCVVLQISWRWFFWSFFSFLWRTHDRFVWFLDERTFPCQSFTDLQLFFSVWYWCS